MAKKSASQPTNKKSPSTKSASKGHAPTMAAAAGAAAGAAAAAQAAGGGLPPGGPPPANHGGPMGPPPDPALAGAAAAPSMVPPGGPPGAAPPMAPPGPPPGVGAPPPGLSMQQPPNTPPPGGPLAPPAPGGAPGAPPSMASPTPGPTGPVGAWAGQPAGSMGARADARTQANFKDLPPLGQAQAMAQGGIDPMAGNKMAAQQLQSSLAAPPQDANGIPNAFSGPGVPPGLENLPHDMAALHSMITPLTATMARGFSPGASTMEHQQGLNASALARAHAAVSLGRAQGQIDHHRNKTMLAQHLMALQQAGQLPSAEEVAQHALAAQPPQLQSQLAGSAPSATPGY